MPRPVIVEKGKGTKSKQAEKLLEAPLANAKMVKQNSMEAKGNADGKMVKQNSKEAKGSANGKMVTQNSKEAKGSVKPGKDQLKDGGNENKNKAAKKPNHVTKKKVAVLADVGKEVVLMVGNGAINPNVEEQFGEKMDKQIVTSKEDVNLKEVTMLFMNDVFNQISDPYEISASKKIARKQQKPKHRDMLKVRKMQRKPLWVEPNLPVVFPQKTSFPDMNFQRHYGRQTNPLSKFKDLVFWRNTLLTGAHVVLAVLLLNTLNFYALIVLLAKTGLIILLNAFLYGSWRQQIRFRPYQKLIVCDIGISPDVLQAVMGYQSECLMLIQKILFNDNILVAICLWLCIIEIRNLFKNVQGLTIFTYSYMGICLAPRVYIDMKALFNRARREAQLPESLRSKTCLMRLLVNFIKPFQTVGIPPKRPKPNTIYVNRGQQTDGGEEVTKERDDLSSTMVVAIEQDERVIEERKDPREIYTLWYILGVLASVSLPNSLKRLVYWENIAKSGIYLLTGLCLLICHQTFIQTFSIVILIEFALLSTYSSLRELVTFGPFEMILRWRAGISKERTINITRTVVNWINRWIATIQYILFSRNLFAALGVWMCLYEMRKLGNAFSVQTLFICVYLCFFLLPVLGVKLLHILKDWRNTTNAELTPFLTYVFMIVDLFDFLQVTTTTEKQTYVNRSQQTDSTGGPIQEKDQLELRTVMASYDPIDASIRHINECGYNALRVLMREFDSTEEYRSLSA
ncbi:uncharacterized protein [Drosophila tropicalis]|uniref:uncharacterized protein n=1 Tax=Drosophila tropicalis TaxID=46794 RepID=UPI0035ABC826